MSSLGTLLFFLAVCISTLLGNVAQELTTNQEPGLQGPTPDSGIEAPCDSDGCPRHKKSATLLPSFTKTTTTRPTTTHRTTHPTTTHRTTHPTTTHRTTHHTTTHRTTPPITTHPANHTTPHPTTHPANHTTPRPTTHPANHTTPRPTTHPANHTTPRPTTHPANHTTPHPTTHPANHTTPRPTTHPANHTTPRPTTHPANHTTPRPTTHPANHTTPHTTPHLTTVAPTVSPDVKVGDYQVKKEKEVCLRIRSGLQIRVEYTNSSKAKLWGTFAVQPNQTKVSGECTNDTATMELSFAQGFLIFTFKKNKTRKTSYLNEVRTNLSLQFPRAMERYFAAQTSTLREFEAGLGHSYQCKNRSLALSPAFHLDALQEQVQAFALHSGNFGEAELCPDQHSLVVPIIIGVVLLVLILIVVIAYLLGRRRARGGYQTI